MFSVTAIDQKISLFDTRDEAFGVARGKAEWRIEAPCAGPRLRVVAPGPSEVAS
jgi:hypothetical protein